MAGSNPTPTLRGVDAFVNLPEVTRLWMLIAFILATGCTRETLPSTGIFVGTLRGGEVFAASIWESDQVLLYTCGSGESLASATAWVVGPPTAGTVEGSESGISLVATMGRDEIHGVLRAGDRQDDFDLRLVSEDETGGFFALIDGPCRTALIAVPHEDGLHFQGAHFCGDAQFSQVTPVLPPETLGTELEVRIEDGSGRVVMLPRLTGI